MRWAVGALLLCLLAAACDTTYAPAGSTASASGSTPAASPSAPLASPQAGHLAGKLPVELIDMSAQAAGGFLDLGTGQFTDDPQAQMVEAGAWTLLKTAASPSLYGRSSGLYGQISYDPVVSRWLPVARAQVAADGLSYAYAQWAAPPQTPCPHGCLPQATGGRIHITDLPSGQDRIVLDFNGDPVFDVVAFSGRDVYLDAFCSNGGSDCNGLWRFEVASNALTRVTKLGGAWWLVDGGFAWMVTAGDGDIAPVYLNRIDLASGASDTWFTVPARSASDPYTPSILLIGLDSDRRPWIALNSRAPSPLLKVTAPGQAIQLLSADGPYSGSVSDDHGTWFAVVDNAVPTPTMLGLYLYTSQQGVREVSALHVIPV